MNKREETAARAAAMLEAGEDPRTVAAACGYKTTSGMLGAIGMIRNKQDARETVPETAQEKPARRAAEIRPELERALQTQPAGEARAERPTLAELLEQEQALKREIAIARAMEERAARTIAENDHFRAMRPAKAGEDYVISAKGRSGQKLFVSTENIDDLRKVIEVMRVEMASGICREVGDPHALEVMKWAKTKNG